MTDLIDARFGAYLIAAILLIVTPGPDTALIIRQALRSGWRASSLSALGIAAGSCIWAIVSVAGIAVLLQHSAAAFTIFKFTGAAYLGYLGLRSLIGNPRTSRLASSGVQIVAAERMDDVAAFKQGLLNNLLNPKAGAIFVTAFPQFLERGDPPLRLLLMLIAYEVILLVWLNPYGYIVSRAGQTRIGTRLRELLERVTGVVLIALGIRLALERP